jgi:hypothetical protein
MSKQSNWKLTVTVSHQNGMVFLFEPPAGAHVQIRELLDSDLALLEFTFTVPRFQAEEVQQALTLSESDQSDLEQSCGSLAN